MADYGKYCPVALATEVIADRWTPLIVRELVLGSTRFNDISRGLPGISRSLLSQRLRHLERSGVVELRPSPTGRGNEYHLTAAGRDLEEVVMSLGRWAIEWLYDELRPDGIDPQTLTWWLHRTIDVERVPAARVVLEFRYTDPGYPTFWMVIEAREVSVCIHHPGFEPDVIITASAAALFEATAGYNTWADVLGSGSVQLEGVPRFTAAVPRWFRPSPFRAELLQQRRTRNARSA